MQVDEERRVVTRLPTVSGEMATELAVALVLVVVLLAFLAYVGTWLAARRA